MGTLLSSLYQMLIKSSWLYSSSGVGSLTDSLLKLNCYKLNSKLELSQLLFVQQLTKKTR